jgi:hypothetical protein
MMSEAYITDVITMKPIAKQIILPEVVIKIAPV